MILNTTTNRDLEKSKYVGYEIAKSVGCLDADGITIKLDCMRGKDAMELVKAAKVLEDKG